MRNTSGLWRGGSPGRPAGTPNRATREVRQFCQHLLSDVEYRKNLETRLRAGTLPHALEALLWGMAYGRPPASLDVSNNHTVTLATLIAGTIPDDIDDD